MFVVKDYRELNNIRLKLCRELNLIQLRLLTNRLGSSSDPNQELLLQDNEVFVEDRSVFHGRCNRGHHCLNLLLGSLEG